MKKTFSVIGRKIRDLQWNSTIVACSTVVALWIRLLCKNPSIVDITPISKSKNLKKKCEFSHLDLTLHLSFSLSLSSLLSSLSLSLSLSLSHIYIYIYIYIYIRGAFNKFPVSPSALTLFLGARFIAWRPFFGKCRQGPRHFWECRGLSGLRPMRLDPP